MYIKLFEDNPNGRDILKIVKILKEGGGGYLSDGYDLRYRL